MKDSGYDSNSAVIAHRASGYAPAVNGFENAGFVNMTVPQGAGALYSTTQDLLKWEQGLFGGKLLKAASLEKMTTPFKQNYAFGLFVDTVGGRKMIEHNGGIQGFNTDMQYFPEDKLTVIVLANVNGSAPGDIAKKLAALAHGETVKLTSERKEITLDPKVLGRLVGAYQMGPGMNMLITLDKNQLLSKLGNQQPVPIYPESETMFFTKVVDAELEFPSLNDKGMASQLILHQNGRDMPAKRLDEAEAKQIAGAAAAFAKRLEDQTADSRSEAALRGLIGELLAGKLALDAMGPNAQRQVALMRPMTAEMGSLQSMIFKGVGPAGPDIYTVKFEKGTLEYRIWIALDGKIDNANARIP